MGASPYAITQSAAVRLRMKLDFPRVDSKSLDPERAERLNTLVAVVLDAHDGLPTRSRRNQPNAIVTIAGSELQIETTFRSRLYPSAIYRTTKSRSI
jgi:hypothetical protein